MYVCNVKGVGVLVTELLPFICTYMLVKNAYVLVCTPEDRPTRVHANVCTCISVDLESQFQ